MPHALQQLCGPHSKVTRGSSQSFTEHDEKTRIKHGHTSQAHLPASPGNQAAEGGGVVRATEGEARAQSGKVVGPKHVEMSLLFYYSLLNKLSAKNIL